MPTKTMPVKDSCGRTLFYVWSNDLDGKDADVYINIDEHDQTYIDFVKEKLIVSFSDIWGSCNVSVQTGEEISVLADTLYGSEPAYDFYMWDNLADKAHG